MFSRTFKRNTFSISAAFCGIIAATTNLQIANAQDQATGWIEGTVVNDAGQAMSGFSPCANDQSFCQSGLEVKILGPSRIKTETDTKLGGFYSVRDLKPGIYEALIPMTYAWVNGKGTTFRPQHIHGIVVKPGVRTVLKIVANPGNEIEDIGQPAVATENVLIISQEIQRLQRQIDELKKR